MKTAAQIIASKLKYTEEEAISKRPLTIEAMQEYARQVAEAVKIECGAAIADYIEHPETTDDDLFQQGIKRGITEINKVDIEQFIK
jgi:hypothetical protein